MTKAQHWIGITGSWRKGSPEVTAAVMREITELLTRGDGIVTGGALGVDYLATELALKFAPNGSRLMIILPTPFEIYAQHYRKRAAEGVITLQQAEELIGQLIEASRVGSLSCMSATEVTEQTYYLRSTEVVNASDEMLAFQVNNSSGTADAINKAKQRGIPIKVFRYTV